MMFDFSENKKAQVYDNLRAVMQICMEHLVKHNKDGKGKQDAEALRNDFAYAFHCMDLCSEYRWIPVTERLPEQGEVVLAFGKRHATSGQFSGTGSNPNVWYWKGSVKTVTHWMPLPDKPEV